MVRLALLLLLGLFGFVRPDDSIYDLAVDSVIESLAEKARHEGKDTMTLPDIDDLVQLKHPRMSIVRLTCRQGEMGSIESIHRVGNVEATDDPPALHLRVRVAFDNLDVQFKRCAIRFSIFPEMSSPVQIRASNNFVDMHVTLAATEANCTVNLDSFQMNQLGHVSIVTKFPVLDFVDETALKVFHAPILKFVNKKITKLADQALKNTNLCSFV